MQRERLSLDSGWLFHQGDLPVPKITGHNESYMNAKAGVAQGAAAPTYDDTLWRRVDLPHDWAVEGGFVATENLAQGYRTRGVGWYRRHFRLPVSDRGRHLELQFDGIASHCTVWLNGSIVHRNFCGYTSFQVDMTPFALYGDAINTLSIRVDADTMEGWWYEGAGLYRHAWLVKKDAVHIACDGVWANPVRADDGTWQVPVAVTMGSSAQAAADVAVAITLWDPAGQRVAARRVRTTVPALAQVVVERVIPVLLPRLWSVADPALYQVRVAVRRDGRTVDEVATTCGFRTIRFDADHGFFLNDQPLKLQGVCNHQDHAGVGVALPDALWEFRLRKLKEMGANAYRCAHNPPAAEFLDACDRLGMLVMDENRHFNCSDEYIRQLEWLVRRDRNHPSVILWSVFNEEPMQGCETGYEMVRRMTHVVKRLDPTRPVTAAMNGGLFDPVNVAQAVDVVGFNYQIWAYDRFHAANPQICLTSSEDTSAFMIRGEYQSDRARNLIDAYDSEAAPWGATHREGWKAIVQRPYLAGGFIWTGFDYHGEPTPLVWPATSSVFGCLDLCGFPKTGFYIHQAHWLTDRPVLQMVPHWNWAGREGQAIRVLVMSNAASVELLLNGRSLGEQAVDPLEMVAWDVPYAPGRLQAIARRDGQEIIRTAVETTGAPVALRLVPDRLAMAGDGADAQPVTVDAVDAQGRAVPTAGLPVMFELHGPGRVIGVGNGDPNSHEPEKGLRRSLFNGLAQVLVQAGTEAGGLTLRASAAGVAPAELTIPITAVSPRPAVPLTEPVFALRDWRMSPVAACALDPNVEVADHDMNSWSALIPGTLQMYTGGTWAVYRARFVPYAAIRQSGGQVRFHGITGKAEIWLDRSKVAVKETMDDAPLSVELPAGEGERVLSVLLEAPPETFAGFSNRVEVSACGS